MPKEQVSVCSCSFFLKDWLGLLCSTSGSTCFRSAADLYFLAFLSVKLNVLPSPGVDLTLTV